LEKPKLKSMRRRYSQIMNTLPSSGYSGSKSLNNLEMMMLPLDIGIMDLNKDLEERNNKSEMKKQLKIKPSCLRLIYEENFDYLISGYEDSRISN